MIFVAGSNGYLGSRIISYLSKKNKNVFGIQRNISNASAIDNLPFSNSLNIKRIDFKNFSQLSSLFEEYSPKIIINAAGPPASFCAENESLVLDECYRVYSNFVKVLEQFQENFIFINLSTIHVYSGNLEGTYLESSETTNTHPYAKYHILREEILSGGLAGGLLNLRLSNGVGTPIHSEINCWGLAINDFIKSAIQDNKIFIRSHPSTLRDYFPISDLEKFIQGVIDSDIPKKNTNLNFSSGKSLSIDEVISKLITIFEKELITVPEIIYRNKNPSNENKSLEINNDRIRSEFGFNFSEIDNELLSLIKFCSLYF